MLPRFLLADKSQEYPETIFIVHNEYPRFIVESDIDDFGANQVIHWIDDEPSNETLIEQLLNDAESFMEEEFDNQENLYDEEFGIN